MVVRNERQALCIAVEMERRAIRVYERALLIAKDSEVVEGIKSILEEEKGHLHRFSEMKQMTCPEQNEDAMITQALGAEVLFTGGVMEMERAKALTTLKGLYAYAAQSEENAVKTYLSFAEKCQDEHIAGVFRAIAEEESSHFDHLKECISEM